MSNYSDDAAAAALYWRELSNLQNDLIGAMRSQQHAYAAVLMPKITELHEGEPAKAAVNIENNLLYRLRGIEEAAAALQSAVNDLRTYLTTIF